MTHDLRALIVPRVVPRAEQLVRTERLARLGLLDLLHPDALTASAIGSWIAGGRRAVDASAIDLDGLAALPTLFRETLARRTPPREVIRAAS